MRHPLVLAAAAVVGLAIAVPAAGGHGDDHTENMRLVATFDDGGTYRQGTDLAFWGDRVVLGSFDNPGGFRLLDISDPSKPALLGRFACPGSQSEVSMWGDLVFVGIDNGRTGPGCDAPASSAADKALGASWEGIRVVSITDPAKPVQVAAVQTDCGSHTHTLIPDLSHREGGVAKPRVLIYANSYPAGRQGSNCNAHFKISVVEVPLARPQDAKVVATPSVGTAVGCHDITVHMARKLAAAACLTESQIWDVSDPLAPRTLAVIRNSSMNIQHSSAWSNDGNTLVLGDELGAAAGATGCLAEGHAPLGALWFYDVRDAAQPAVAGSFVIPRREISVFCTAHNFAPVPLHGDRDVLVSGWYNGGTTVLDFTDPSNVVEIGHYTPRTGLRPAVWSAYWYNGYIYANNFDEGFVVGAGKSRGLDVLKLDDPAVAGAATLGHLNPQTQEPLPARTSERSRRRDTRVLGGRRGSTLPSTGVASAWPGAALVVVAAVAAAATRRSTRQPTLRQPGREGL